jgi:hypothetical protein
MRCFHAFVFLSVFALAPFCASAARRLCPSATFPYRRCANASLPWRAALAQQTDLGTEWGSTLVSLRVWTNESCTRPLHQLDIGLPDMACKSRPVKPPFKARDMLYNSLSDLLCAFACGCPLKLFCFSCLYEDSILNPSQ